MPTLDFKGKPFVYSHHLSVPFRTLDVVADKSLPGDAGPSLDDNLIIHGDNLHALKALLPKYAGKVDVIYIDPPYNTGNEGWAYNDNVNSPLMKEWLGKTVDGEDLERHDKWLCMMWPRLVLLRELLSATGVIFVSIDDHEHARLKLALDEIFNGGFITSFVWKRRASSAMSSDNLSRDHEYVLGYFKTDPINAKGIKKGYAAYKNLDNDPRGEWVLGDLTVGMDEIARPGQAYSIKDPKTGNVFNHNPDRVWAYAPDNMEKMISDNRVYFPQDRSKRPMKKRFKNELQNSFNPISSFIADKVGMNSEGTALLKSIFGKKSFDYSKPPSLIKFLIDQFDNKDAVILDSFAGSGTTAHAVQALNAEDGGSRRFILIETEDYADTITAERVRRVINGVPSAKDEKLKAGLGGSFTYCELGEPMDMESFFGESKSMPSYEQLARYIAYTATGEAMDKAPKKPAKDWFIGEVAGVRLYLIYKPDSGFMKGHDAALDMDTVKTIAAGNTSNTPSYVFAAAKYMGQSELTRDYNMTFCQLPYAIHRIMGDGVED